MVIKDLPSFQEDFVDIMPKAVLKSKRLLREGRQIPQGVIKWSNLPQEETTREDQSFILKQFPEFKSSWGQEGSLGEGGYCHVFLEGISSRGKGLVRRKLLVLEGTLVD